MSKTIENYINIARNTEDLSADNEKIIIQRAKNGDEKAKNLLFISHLKMIISIAKKYAVHNETLEDLTQEGVKGIEHALDLFKADKNTRFSTYARFWVRAYILKYFNDNIRGFRVPTEISVKLYGINKIIEKLSKELLREPTDEEIAAESDFDESHIAFLRKYLVPHCSFDSDENSDDFKNHSDDHRDNAHESLSRTDGINKIKSAIQSLSKKEKFVISSRYGLNGEGDGEGMTLSDVGKELDLTPERIRQIQLIAEKKLKNLIDK